ncbi:hypothetical protein J3R30DRAFT_3511673 [Lentinula aciculospora]|uniref:Zn(2)-C6 fungal-type domain-containing protein n=1 Tax=Lentinula aciculospora TaxID=153920 RepID=A0A9W9A579_9AGAR|nr:hypothetical protein J3R30DRAFT_3511673 [Lentinula aciculospora]
MSRNFNNTFANSHPYEQLNMPASSSSSPSSSSGLPQDMTSALPMPPLQVVPAPPPDRPKRKRLARACNSCHKSKRRCDGTAPCSNCYYASKPCTYTDSSGRTVPAPRTAGVGLGNILPNSETGNNTQYSIEMVQTMGPQDGHLASESRPFRPQQSSYGHAGPPYYLPPPSLPPLLLHQQQSQSSSSFSHQQPYLHPSQYSSSDVHNTPLVVPRRELDGNSPSSSSTLQPHPEILSRKRQRQGSISFDSRQMLDANRARDKENQQTATIGGYAARPSIELEPALTRELTNLFFTHSHPMVMIIHKPSFTNAVTMNQVPMYLLYAVCALASRHSKQPSLAASPRRLSGRQFADEAVRLMFAPRKKFTRRISVGEGREGDEGSSTDDLYRGELVLPASLYTAQTLCLLAVYELLAWQQKTLTGPRSSIQAGDSSEQEPKLTSPQGERFRELALEMLQELGVHEPTYPLLTPVPSQSFIEENIEMECIRRIFWLIYILDCMRAIYYQGEGSLLGGSGRGYHSGETPGVEPSSSTAAVQSSANSQRDSQSSVSSVSVLEPYKPSARTTLNISASLSNSPSFPDHNVVASSSPSMRAFSNGFIGFSAEELRVRLPVDETSFEMGVVHECLPEYLYLPSTPAPSTDLPSYKALATGSELAQTIRILSIYNKIERTLDGLYPPSPRTANTNPTILPKFHARHYQARASLSSALAEDHQLFSMWDESHPFHLRWDEGENVVVQKSMLETNSNTGAWCFCLIALLEASCIMGFGMGRRAIYSERWPYREHSTAMKDVDITGSMVPNEGTRSGVLEVDSGPDWWKVSHRKDRPGETDLSWGVRRLDNVIETLGDRAASSAAMGAWLWPLIKYMHRDDEKIQKGLDGFEEFCGVRMDELAGNNWGASPIGVSTFGEGPDAEMADATIYNAEIPTAIQDGHVLLDSLSSSSSFSIASGHIESGNQLPMLQTQTTLPSLKSSGLLDWSSRSSLATHPGAAPMHNHSLPQLNMGAANLNTYAGDDSPRSSGYLTTPTTTPTDMSISVSGSSMTKSPTDAFSSTTPGTTNTQQGRSGLSWMMNE